jgi:ribosomal protein S18 acetylase RimI-like enzyme
MCSIRQATLENIHDIAAIHLASEQAAYKNIVDQPFLDKKTSEEYEVKWKGWLIEEGIDVSILYDGNIPKGFISYGRMQTPPPGTSKIRPQYTSEIFAIHIHPDYWRQGLGQSLILNAVQNLKDQKHQSVCLWVLAKNERATKFYDHLGGKRLGKRMIEVGRFKLKEICYGWRDINEILERS